MDLEPKRFKQREALAQPRATSWRAACQCSVSLETLWDLFELQVATVNKPNCTKCAPRLTATFIKIRSRHMKISSVEKFRFHTGYTVNNLQTKINCLAVVWFISLEIIILVCGLKCRYVYYKSLRCVAQKEDIVKLLWDIQRNMKYGPYKKGLHGD